MLMIADFLTAAYKAYPEHRTSIMEDIISTVVPHLAPRKPSSRKSMDASRQKNCIPPAASLLLSIVQVDFCP